MKRFLKLAFILFPMLLVAQTEILDEEKWSELRKDVEFIESSRSKTKQSEDAYDEGNIRKTEEDESSETILNLGPLFQIIIIILFILFIVALLYTILSNVSLRKKTPEIPVESIDAITSIEENFNKANLERWLKHAREQKDYYLILRIQFLMILKNLDNQRLILWKKDKTNWHYIQELKDHHFQSPFKDLVFEFDHVWYGEKKYSKEDLVGKIEQFESFKKIVDKQ